MTASSARYQWQIAAFDAKTADELARSCGIPRLLALMLLLRGVDTPEDARAFLRPSLQQLSCPFELDGMRAAVERVRAAKSRNESVLVFGDYDVDGVAATAILAQGLRRFGIERVGCDMPDRFTEGYGLMPEHVEKAKEEGYSLLITVDNGISAHAAAARARAVGLDLIITDHHALDATLPDAVAVVNPKRGPSDHATAMIAGAGVAFKLALALNESPNALDIVALGTVSDIVPLLGENRIFTALGLKHIKKYRRLGIAKLARAASFSLEDISAQKIGFQLGPRLNAAGRLDTGHAALELLMTDDEARADMLAKTLNKANEERRAIEREIYEQAIETLEAFMTEEQRSIVLAREDWHQGVVGIVASRLQNRYYRPSIVFSMGEDGYWHGSARGGPGFNMIAALQACDGLLLKYGGHAAAAGMTVAPEYLSDFRERFESEALRQLGAGKLQPRLQVDAMVALGQLDSAFIRGLELLEPYGQANPQPMFCAADVEVVPHSMRVLKDLHVKFSVRQGDVQIDVIAFQMAERFCTESLPERADIVFTPQINTFNNVSAVQLVLKDLRVASRDARGN